MEKIMDANINLFENEIPSLEQLKQLATNVNSSEQNKIKFAQQVEENTQDSLRTGIGCYILGNYKLALEMLQKAADQKEKHFYLALAYRKAKDCQKALQEFDKAAEKGVDGFLICLEKAETHRQAGSFDQAHEELKNCKNFENVSADYHCQKGRIFDSQGDYQKAVSNYENAIELDSNHQQALFLLAYTCDLRGDDDAAIDYYKQASMGFPVHVNSLLNLAVLYEEKNQYTKAIRCVEAVLRSHPNHKKARLFKKDIESSMIMIYDEEKEKRKDRQNQILEIPISDFELSVRSRNCLRKMNIRTIGDLLNITEAELLSYKNFGETSLNEIKKILDMKGLSLGMATENAAAASANQPAKVEGADEEMVSKPVEDLELSVRAKRCLTRLGIRTIGDLISKTEAELLGCKNFGVTSLNEIKERLSAMGLSLRTLE
jgi:DNA-directed RNA polymerase subunit alpha